MIDAMMRSAKRPLAGWRTRDRFSLVQSFRDSTSGIASVEFAILSTTLLAMLAGFLDVSYMVRARQYSDRSSMLLARAVASCQGDSGCSVRVMSQLMDGKANILVRYPSAEIGMATFQMASGKIKMCAGQMTYLESDVETSVKSILKNGDTGVAAYVRTSYKSFFPSFVRNYIASAAKTYRDYTVDVSAHDRPCA